MGLDSCLKSIVLFNLKGFFFFVALFGTFVIKMGKNVVTYTWHLEHITFLLDKGLLKSCLNLSKK